MNKNKFQGRRIEFSSEGFYLLSRTELDYCWIKVNDMDTMNEAGRRGIDIQYIEACDLIIEEKQGFNE